MRRSDGPSARSFNEAKRNLSVVVTAGKVGATQGLRLVGVEAQNTVRLLLTGPSPSSPGQPPGLVHGGLRLSYGFDVAALGEQDVLSVASDAGTRRPITGEAVDYACVLGSHTSVVTESGSKTIGQIKAGDRVLTQAGDFREVLSATRFPAVEKPELIDIETEWRSDRTHKITLTRDHKVLVFRGGRNKWVQAGDLRMTDRMFKRAKVSPRKGFRRWKTCLWCDQSHQGQGHTYCSIACRAEHWATGTNPHFGAKRSAETKERIGAAKRDFYAAHPERHANAIMGAKGFMTDIERSVASWLTLRGVDFERQVRVARKWVDFRLYDGTIMEADGAFWHQDQAVDIERDRRLLDHVAGPVVHLHFYDERFSPDLDPNPVPGAFYVSCNPGPDSFVDPEQFDVAPILSLRPWVYERPSTGPGEMLYDLSVEGVHSFVASGLVLSNSYQEEGTTNMAPRPHLRPAMAIIMPLAGPMISRSILAAERTAAAGLRGTSLG